MTQYNFEIGSTTFLVSEGSDLTVNRRAVTEWEVREVCTDSFDREYYHQRGNAFIPRRATIAQIKAHIADKYVNAQNEDEFEDEEAA